MKTARYIFATLIAVAIFGCQKDPLTEINDGSWNKERNIINIAFADQVGKASIKRDGDNALIEFSDYSDNFGAIEVKSLELSFGATASVSAGGKLNFDNPDKTATITVTPANGEPLTWTLKASKFINPYKGTWSIQNFKFKWDDWNGWGLQGEANVTDKMVSVANGMDDIITFGAIEGASPAGLLYGMYERKSGANAAFGSYGFKSVDWSDKFGQLPNGAGKYYINSDNTVSIEIDGSSKKLTSKGSKQTDGTTMTYQLNAAQNMTIDWVDYYSTENQLKVAFEIWYILKKQ